MPLLTCTECTSMCPGTAKKVEEDEATVHKSKRKIDDDPFSPVGKYPKQPRTGGAPVGATVGE